MGPGVHIYGVNHPLDVDCRHRLGLEKGEPVSIGNNVWIGGRAIILPGVTIGDGCVVGAGSVVTQNVSDCCLVVGNPARFVRQLKRKA